MTAPPRAVQLAQNALTGAGRFATSAVLALFITPFTLHALGRERYGVWALAAAVLPVARLLDLGLQRAVTRAVADARGQGDSASAVQAVAVGRWLLFAMGGLVVAVLALGLEPLLAGALRLPAPFLPEARYVLLGTALVVWIENLFAPFEAALEGLGRLDLANGVDTLQRVGSAVGAWAVLGSGWGLEGLVWKNAATALAAGLGYWWLLRRLDADLARPRARWDAATARRLFAFGRHVQTVNLAALLVEPVSKVLLLRQVGLETVGLYELAVRITSQVGGAFLALATAIFPAAAEARSRRAVAASQRVGGFDLDTPARPVGTSEKLGPEVASSGWPGRPAKVDEEATLASGTTEVPGLSALYRSAVRYVAWLALPCFALLAVLADPFVTAWLGPGYAPVAWAISLLALAWLLAILSIPAFLVAQGGGHERLATMAGLVTPAVTLALAAITVRPFGFYGVVAGNAAGLAAGAVVILALLGRVVPISDGGTGETPRGGRPAASMVSGAWSALSAIGFWPPVAATLAAVGALVAARAAAESEVASLPMVLAIGCIGLIGYGAILLATGTLGARERALLRGLVVRNQ